MNDLVRLVRSPMYWFGVIVVSELIWATQQLAGSFGWWALLCYLPVIAWAELTLRLER